MTIEHTATCPELSPEQIAYRELIATFKQDIKTDMLSIRAEKREINEIQKAFGPGSASGYQSNLSTHRVKARARHLTYGMLRGRTWGQIEPKHAPTNSRLRYWIDKLWADTHTSVPMPDGLKEVA